MTLEALQALLERVWLGPGFTLAAVDAVTVEVHVDTRGFWPGGPRSLVAKQLLNASMTPGEVIVVLQRAAATALAHELEEQTCVDGMRWSPPHPAGRLKVDLATGNKETR